MGRKLWAFFVVLVLLLSGCEPQMRAEPTSNVTDSQAVIDALNAADVITAKKHVFSFGDKWDIYADGTQVGYVSGEVIPTLGDSYILYSNSGNVVAAEDENVFTVFNRATTYDMHLREIGEIRGELSLFLMKMRIVRNGEIVGRAEQRFAIGLSAEIVNANGEAAWTARRRLISFGDEIALTGMGAKGDVDAVDALWTALIMNEISNARGKSNSK